jgi:uncharacterized protein
MQFEWDEKKAASNIQKHGVSFQEARTVFKDTLALYGSDDVHADREIVIGESENARLLLVVYIEVEEDTTRIISARRATPHERRKYEEGK